MAGCRAGAGRILVGMTSSARTKPALPERTVSVSNTLHKVKCAQHLNKLVKFHRRHGNPRLKRNPI